MSKNRTKEPTPDEKALLKFHNTIRLVFDSYKKITRLEIINGLHKIIKPDDTKSILGISHESRATQWLVLFNDSFNASSLFGKTLVISDTNVKVVDPKMNDKVETLRCMWLPFNFPIRKVKSCLLSIGVTNENIISIEHEKTRDNLLTGIIIVKLAKHQNNEELLGIRYIGWFRTYITRQGDPVRCFFCSSTDHQKVNCPKFKEKQNEVCEKCNKRGHLGSECSLARRLAPSPNEDDNHVHLDDELNGLNDKQKSDGSMESSDSEEEDTTTIGSIMNDIAKQSEKNPSNSLNQHAIGSSDTTYNIPIAASNSDPYLNKKRKGAESPTSSTSHFNNPVEKKSMTDLNSKVQPQPKQQPITSGSSNHNV